ncbi:hypothetical protein HPB51_022690 [Rhipicephalus microplus]|uniref:Transmembrane protein n=1 Tax=Rhipicephalus microplus TaxID=6941 RepID=A0A9J6E4B1_RHIMP|nr:hypothetical protein HPB51_022690 [Rhipicephalus microplus]
MSLDTIRAPSVKSDASRLDSRDQNMPEKHQPAVPYGPPAQSPEGTNTILLRWYADLAIQQEQCKRHKERSRERKAYLAVGASVAAVLLLMMALVSKHVFSASSLPRAGTIFHTTPPAREGNVTSWFVPATNDVYDMQLDSELLDRDEGPPQVEPESHRGVASEESAFEKCRTKCIGDVEDREKSSHDATSDASADHHVSLVRRRQKNGAETRNTVRTRCLELCSLSAGGSLNHGDDASLSNTKETRQQKSESNVDTASQDSEMKKPGDSNTETTLGRSVTFDVTAFVTKVTTSSSDAATVPHRVTTGGTRPDFSGTKDNEKGRMNSYG